jgi:hypothetical protein
MNLTDQNLMALTRRAFLGKTSGLGIGSLALAGLLNDETQAASKSASPFAAKQPHFPATAKHIIYLHMVGAPSQLELFENKPVLREHNGKQCPKELLEGQRFAFLKKDPKLLGSPFKFKKYGDAGIELSEMLPHLGTVSDEIAVVKSLHTSEFNHGPSQVFMFTGFSTQGRPSLGSWLSYGLGSPSSDLPGLVVLVTGLTPGGGTSLWGSGFLPSAYQGVQFRTKGEPVLFVTNPNGLTTGARRRIVDDIRKLNEIQLEETGDPEIQTRISSYEMAYRMQSSVPGLMDIAGEPKHIHEMYGTQPGKPSFANNCLLARRMVERGVRVVQLFDQGWDHHGSIKSRLPQKCKQVDQPIAALIKDLKQRGLLDDTLIVFGGEFGRTPMLQGSAGPSAGRDHHKDAFSIWMAGGGIKPGVTVGKTDDLGYHIVEDPVSVHDLHATILHLMGMDHKRLIHCFQGRDYRLTDVAGKVVEKLLA